MGAVMGGLLPLAAGVAITPLPVTLVLLILLTSGSVRPARWFMVGWAVGLIAALAFFLVMAHTIGLARTGPSRLVAGIEVLVGLGSAGLALLVWRARPAPGAPPSRPRWVQLLATLNAPRSAGLGFALAAFGPKNIALNIAAAVVVAGAALAAGDTAVAVVVYLVLAASTVAAPVIVHAVAGERVRTPLDRLRAWLGRHSAAVTAVLLAGFAVILIGDGLLTMP